MWKSNLWTYAGSVWYSLPILLSCEEIKIQEFWEKTLSSPDLKITKFCMSINKILFWTWNVCDSKQLKLQLFKISVKSTLSKIDLLISIMISATDHLICG